jgi:hypothetical protein
VRRLRSAASRSLGWLAAGAVVALAAVAVVDAVWERGGDGSQAAAAEERLRGAGVPAAHALSGSLTFVERSGCVLGSLDLAELAVVRQAVPGGCTIAVSPDGRWATVGRADGSASHLVRVSSPPETVRSLGHVRGAVAWSEASDRVAWCRPDGRTVVLAPATGRTDVRAGCGPRFAADGTVLTVVGALDGRGVYADGRLLLDEEDLREALDRTASGPVRPLAADRRDDGTVAVVVSATPRDIYDLLEQAGIDPTGVEGIDEARKLLGLDGQRGAIAVSGSGTVPRTELQLWRDGRLEAAHPLRAAGYPFTNRRFGELLEFSPGGDELAIGFDGTGVPLMLLDVETLGVILRPTLQHGFAWSPDGAYFALSNGAQVTIAGALRSEPAYVLPLAASALAWRTA